MTGCLRVFFFFQVENISSWIYTYRLPQRNDKATRFVFLIFFFFFFSLSYTTSRAVTTVHLVHLQRSKSFPGVLRGYCRRDIRKLSKPLLFGLHAYSFLKRVFFFCRIFAIILHIFILFLNKIHHTALKTVLNPFGTMKITSDCPAYRFDSPFRID